MAHTRKAAILIIDELQEKLKDQDIALAKRLEWIGKVEAQNADLLAALGGLLREIEYVSASGPLIMRGWNEIAAAKAARAAIEKAS